LPLKSARKISFKNFRENAPNNKEKFAKLYTGRISPIYWENSTKIQAKISPI
jgi:hypothetical protein